MSDFGRRVGGITIITNIVDCGSRSDDDKTLIPSENDIIDMYQRLLASPQVSTTSKQYVLLSLVKLSTRLRSGLEYVQHIYSQ